mgnify:FL=1
MRRLILVLASLTLTLAAITTPFLPERCEVCNRRLFRMSFLASLWHGHGEHLTCLDCFAKEFPGQFPLMQLSPPKAPLPLYNQPGKQLSLRTEVQGMSLGS